MIFSLIGVPLPKVTWWKGDQLFDSSDEIDSRRGLVSNRMVYRSLQREDLGTVFTCQAMNTNLTNPVLREVKVTLKRECACAVGSNLAMSHYYCGWMEEGPRRSFQRPPKGGPFWPRRKLAELER